MPTQQPQIPGGTYRYKPLPMTPRQSSTGGQGRAVEQSQPTGYGPFDIDPEPLPPMSGHFDESEQQGPPRYPGVIGPQAGWRPRPGQRPGVYPGMPESAPAPWSLRRGRKAGTDPRGTQYDDMQQAGGYPAFPGQQPYYPGHPGDPMPPLGGSPLNQWGGQQTTGTQQALPPYPLTANPSPDGYGHTDPMGHQYDREGPPDDDDDDQDDSDTDDDSDSGIDGPGDEEAMLTQLMESLTQACDLLQQAMGGGTASYNCGGGHDKPVKYNPLIAGAVSGAVSGMMNSRYDDEADRVPWNRIRAGQRPPVPIQPRPQQPIGPRAQGGPYPKTPPGMYPQGRFPGGKPLQSARYHHDGEDGVRYRGPGQS